MFAIDILNITPEYHPSGIFNNCFKFYFFYSLSLFWLTTGWFYLFFLILYRRLCDCVSLTVLAFFCPC